MKALPQPPARCRRSRIAQSWRNLSVIPKEFSPGYIPLQDWAAIDFWRYAFRACLVRISAPEAPMNAERSRADEDRQLLDDRHQTEAFRQARRARQTEIAEDYVELIDRKSTRLNSSH